MQLNYLNKPHFENGAIKNISQVLEEHGIKNPLICTDPGLASIGMSDMIRNLLSNELSPSFYEDTPANPTEQAVNDALEIGSYPFSKDNRFGTTLVMRSSNEKRLHQCDEELKELMNEYDTNY